MKNMIALPCGLVFGVGLAVSGMTDSTKVLGFLDVSGDWVPDLAFVMGGAVCVTLLAFPLVLRRAKPLLSASFSLPANKSIDGRLLGGAALSLASAGVSMATAPDRHSPHCCIWTGKLQYS